MSITSILCDLSIATDDNELHKEISLVAKWRFLVSFYPKLQPKNL